MLAANEITRWLLSNGVLITEKEVSAMTGIIVLITNDGINYSCQTT